MSQKNNVIPFPMDRSIARLEVRKSVTESVLNYTLSNNEWDTYEFVSEDIVDLAMFGEIMSFSEIVNKRLISKLAEKISKLEIEIQVLKL